MMRTAICQLVALWIMVECHGGLVIEASTSFVMDKPFAPIGQRRCTKPVPIQIPECQNTFYNYTGMPNLVDQETQFDARHQLQTFKPLITYKCSSKLNFFLCSVYTPMCDVNTRHLIGPCRPLCEHVRARCAPVLRVFDFDWPANLNCSRFPVKNSVDGAMCMEGPQDVEESLPLTSHTAEPSGLDVNLPERHLGIAELETAKNTDSSSSLEHNVDELARNDDVDPVNRWILRFAKLQLAKDQEAKTSHSESTTTNGPSSISLLAQSLRHCSYLKKPTYYVYVNRTGRCAPMCKSDILFTPDAKTLVFVWTSILTAICSVITAFTLIGYVLDTSVFDASERPIIYVTMCQLLYSLGYALSLGLGRETVTCGPDLDSGRSIRLQEGLDNSLCALVFMMQYFFFIASLIWWALIAIHWALEYSSCWMSSVCWDSGEVSSIRDSSGHESSCSDMWGDVRDLNSVFANRASRCLETDQNWSKDTAQISENETRKTVSKDKSGLSAPTPIKLCPLRPGETASYCLQNGKVVPMHQLFGCTNRKQDAGLVSHRYTTRINDERFTACLAREHVVVWLTAGLLTVGVLVSRQVDADELIPICGVGRQHTKAMGAFVICPQLILTLIGTVTLITGLILSLTRHKRAHCGVQARGHCARATDLPTSDSSRLLRDSPLVPQNEHTTKTHNSQSRMQHKENRRDHKTRHSSMPPEFYCYGITRVSSPTYPGSCSNSWLRMGLFCFLYLMPVICVTACDLYEYLSRDKWLRDSTYKSPQHEDGQIPAIPFPPKLWKPEEVVGPNPEFFMLRIFMSLIAGFTCALWICSVKGCRPWTRLCRSRRFCLLRGSAQRWYNRKSPTYIDPTASSWSKPSTMKQQLEKPAFSRDQYFTSDITGHEFRDKADVPTLPMSYTPHPYAVYQYNPPCTAHARSIGQENPTVDLGTTMISGSGAPWNKSIPVVIDPDTQAGGLVQRPETQHSNATTPGYYSQAKVGSSIEQNSSDTFSEESPVPPPLPASSRPQLPARGEPCIGASTTHVSALTTPHCTLHQRYDT